MSNAHDLVFQAGTHEDAIRLKFNDWRALVNPRASPSPCRNIPRPRLRSRTGTTWGKSDRPGHRSGAPSDRSAESGEPGGGQGRVDVVGHTGVYPGSGPYPSGPATVRTPAEFVHGQHDEEGREVEGGSTRAQTESTTLPNT